MYSVYLLHNSDGVLIYVGATSNLTSRLNSHASTQLWWHEVDLTNVHTKWFKTHDEAADTEWRLIRDQQPRHNSTTVGRYMGDNRAREGQEPHMPVRIGMTAQKQQTAADELVMVAKRYKEAEAELLQLQQQRLTAVENARTEGVTWRAIEVFTGTTRQTLTKGLNQ